MKKLSAKAVLFGLLFAAAAGIFSAAALSAPLVEAVGEYALPAASQTQPDTAPHRWRHQ